MRYGVKSCYVVFKSGVNDCFTVWAERAVKVVSMLD